VTAIWENPFANAHLKVERAKKHISDIEKRLRTSPDMYAPCLNHDGQTGKQILYYGLSDRMIRADLALLMGDAIHNLKCALDFAWCGAVAKLNPGAFNLSHTKFPVFSTRKELESALTNKRKVASGSPLFDLLVNRVKSYEGGDSDIWAIHRLDIDDKHHLLIPLVSLVSIDGVELENKDGTVDRFTYVPGTYPSLPYRLEIPDTSHVKSNGEVTIRVTFGEGPLGDDIEICSTLRRFSAKVLQIVRILQRMAMILD
jgi:hypothetical protein